MCQSTDEATEQMRQSNAALNLQAAAVAEVTDILNFKIHSAITTVRIRVAETPLRLMKFFNVR
jgi:hypothetical protein